jgi:cell fate regulator YaaT (PSP1 superfamily)
MEATVVKIEESKPIRLISLNSFKVKKDDYCIIKIRDKEILGKVILNNSLIISSSYTKKLPLIVRLATEDDLKYYRELKEKNERAFAFCAERIKARELPMKLVRAEFINQGKKAIFYFRAEGRVDFRELVKDLAREFKVRIELRQIGVRDEAKLISGIGLCGRTLCCASFMNEFTPVSIRMAKEQNLPLNPVKISGLCGRLMCCLTFEAGKKPGKTVKDATAEEIRAEEEGKISS